jgi:hypothetical protein
VAEGNLERVGQIELDGQHYILVRDDKKRAWRRSSAPEPPYDGGLPTLISRRWDSWHLGAFKSREGIPSTSEFGDDTTGRWPGRLLPSYALNTITLTNSDSAVIRFFELGGYLWAVTSNGNVYRIDPADDTVLEKDLAVTAIDGVGWENVGYVTSNAATNSIWKVVSPYGTANWTQQSTGTYYPYRLAKNINRLFATNKTGLVKNIASGTDGILGASYSDAVQCGDAQVAPNALVAYGRSVICGKPEGLFSIDAETGVGKNELERMIRDPDNCIGMYAWEPWVFVPHSRGLWRWQPGFAEDIGLEREFLADPTLDSEDIWNAFDGQFRAFAAEGHFVWAVRNIGNAGVITQLLVGREAVQGEPSLGPMIWDIESFDSGGTARTQAAFVSSLWTPPRLFIGLDNNCAYMRLTDEGSPPAINGQASGTFVTSGYRYTPWLKYDSEDEKDHPKVSALARHVDRDRYWQIKYRLTRDAAESSTDVDGNAMKVMTSDRLHTFYLPSTASGREIQYRIDYVSDVSTDAGELTYFEAFAAPQSRKVPIVIARLHLATGMHTERGRDPRTVDEMIDDLYELSEEGPLSAITAPWIRGGGYCQVKSVELVETRQEGTKDPEFVVEVALQMRDVAGGRPALYLSSMLSPNTVAEDAAVGTLAWTTPSNAAASDNAYATANPTGAGQVTRYLKATNFGFAVPANATILGIVVEIERKELDAGVNAADSEVKLVKADGTIGTTNKAAAPEWPLADAYATYGDTDDLWGETLTPTDVNDADFGVVLSVTATHTSASPEVSVDHIRITIWYSIP